MGGGGGVRWGEGGVRGSEGGVRGSEGGIEGEWRVKGERAESGRVEGVVGRDPR